MKLKYLYIIAVVAVFNILNTNVALADLISPVYTICPFIFMIFYAIMAVFTIKLGICGLKYVITQKDKKNTPEDSDN